MKCARNQNVFCRVFLVLCGIILLLSSIAKIISAFGSARILDTFNWVFHSFSERQVLFFTGTIELLIVAVLVFSKNVNIKLFVLFWLASQFLLYHYGITGAPASCPCLGRAAEWLHVQQQVLEKISMAFALFIFLGSLFFGALQFFNPPNPSSL